VPAPRRSPFAITPYSFFGPRNRPNAWNRTPRTLAARLSGMGSNEEQASSMHYIVGIALLATIAASLTLTVHGYVVNRRKFRLRGKTRRRRLDVPLSPRDGI
jgi:hypothetical protein